MPYMNVNQVEAAIVTLAGPPNTAITQLITLPNTTHGEPGSPGRVCRAIKIANGSGPGRIGVYFIGGVHAREWGNPDICIFFIEQLTQAYRTGSGIVLGGKSFSAAQVQSIVNTLDLFIFPQVNPDGRHYSMTVDTMWRKNRRSGLGPGVGCSGVDINRNYDFLWNYPAFFSAAAPVANSTTTCGPSHSAGYNTYIGPGAASEPETRNVVWIVDTNPHVRFFRRPASLLRADPVWLGRRRAASSDTPSMDFRNAGFNSIRGLKDGAAYSEYLEPCDQTLLVDLATRMRDGIAAVRSRTYKVQSSFELYPTAGTSTDYMFSRHITNRGRGKIHAFTIESGSRSNETPFHPPYGEMQNIIQEVTAGLLEFCLGILATHADVHIRDNLGDTGGVPSAGPFWESPDVVIRQADDNAVVYEPARRGQPNFLYVQVRNLGPNVTRDVRVSARAVRFPGTEFVYPYDWTTVNATHLEPAAIANTFSNIPSGSTRVAKFRLSTAQVETLWGWQSGGWHPCLLAEASGCNDYGSPVGPHVWENNNLGQRNVSIVESLLQAYIEFPFLVSHELSERTSVVLRIDRRGLPEAIELLLDVSPRRRPFRGVRLMKYDPRNAEASVLDMSGAEFVTHRRRTMLAIRDREATVRLAVEPGRRRQLALHFRVPKQAEPGEEYRIDVAQHDGQESFVGGITLLTPIRT